GTGYAAAGIEIVGLRVVASTALHLPSPVDLPRLPATGRSTTRLRRAWFDGAFSDVAVLESADLDPGRELAGPMLIDLSTVTGVLHPGHRSAFDGHRNLELRLV